MTPTEAVLEAAPEVPITFEIWRCYRANNSWVSAGRFPTYAAALRAVPNRGRAPGWVVLPVWARSARPAPTE
ncbi:hypothetical protein R5W24_002128 [Gemmata sp. JC717]|uniref:hypothetical protein n=1 Tax=Gemmata algarum TaxID=2975278 RepID=UPI0021BB267D|nr:hypothetical protein [Gemmata algarum]MDY3553038.1 hypothetical protein [Gemmata algarum]